MVEINEKQLLDSSFNEFKDIIKENPKIITQIDNALSLLENSHKYPFALIEIHQILARILGENAANYFLSVLIKGIPEEHKEEWNELPLDLLILVYKYNSLLICANKFFNNPLDYASLQVAASDKAEDLIHLRILRADKAKLDLHIDLPTFGVFASHVLGKLNKVIQNKQLTLPKKVQNQLMKHINEFMEISGGSHAEKDMDN